jgi:hypothetical protein
MPDQKSPDKDQESAGKTESREQGDSADAAEGRPAEYGGPKGKEPTRYGDWEKKGRCIDF